MIKQITNIYNTNMENENNWSDITDSLGNVAKKLMKKLMKKKLLMI